MQHCRGQACWVRGEQKISRRPTKTMSQPIIMSHGNRVRERSGGRTLVCNKRSKGGQETQPATARGAPCPWDCQHNIQLRGQQGESMWQSLFVLK